MLYGHPHQTKVIRTLLRLEMGSDLLLYISKIKFFHFSHKEKSKTVMFIMRLVKVLKIYIRKNDNTVSFITLPS